MNLLEIYGIYEAGDVSQLHSQKAIPFVQLKVLEPEFARGLEDWYEKELGDTEIGAEFFGKDVLKGMLYRSNPNGSWEGWSTDDRYNFGVDVWDPKTKTWSNSDYEKEEWFDKVTGIKNWSTTVSAPKGIPSPSYEIP